MNNTFIWNDLVGETLAAVVGDKFHKILNNSIQPWNPLIPFPKHSHQVHHVVDATL